MLFLRPGNTSLALALAVLAGVERSGVVGGRVTGGGEGSVFVVVGFILRMHVLRQIVHTDAFPHGVHHHPNAEQHNLAGGGGVTVAGDGGVCGGGEGATHLLRSS